VVCSVGTVTSEGVVTVIPFTNTYASDNEVSTTEFVVLVSTSWEWKLVIVIGSDRNMFLVGFYPAGADIVADVDYIAERSSAIFFEVNDPTTDPVIMVAGDAASFTVVGVTADEFIIGALGIDSLLTCTCTGAATNNWLT